MIVDRGGELPASFRHQPAGGVLDFGLEPLLEGTAASPAGIAGRNSTMMVPGRRTNCRRGQNSPEFSPKGTQATPVPR